MEDNQKFTIFNDLVCLLLDVCLLKYRSIKECLVDGECEPAVDWFIGVISRAASNELIAPVPSKQISICSANASDYDVVLAVGGKIG